MRDLVFQSTTQRWCAAPREAILAWERDPYAPASTNARVRVSNFAPTSDGVGSRWRFTITVAGFLRVRMDTLLMALDPVIVEARSRRQVSTSTTAVSAEPDESGRHLVNFAHDSVVTLPPFSHWYYGRKRGALQRKLDRVLGDYADKTVLGIEARARAAEDATRQD